MYTETDYQTKRELRAAVTAGDRVPIFQPGPFARPRETYTGEYCVEGPHFPKAHTWYARVRAVAGVVVKVLS